MNYIFLFTFYISFICIPVFILWALINLIRKKPAKKRFIFAGISVLGLIISTVGFGLTMDDDATLNKSVDIVSESPTTMAELPTATPTVQPITTSTPTTAPTPKPTTSSTPQPTATPRPTPTPQPTATPRPTPTLQPTATPQPTSTPRPSETPAPQDIENSVSQSTEVPMPPSTESSSSNSTTSGSNKNNFNTYDNPEQQQTTDTYVLNTNRYKIHYPSCSSVAKIAPKNYATSNSSIEELKAQGYTTCGICFK